MYSVLIALNMISHCFPKPIKSWRSLCTLSKMLCQLFFAGQMCRLQKDLHDIPFATMSLMKIKNKILTPEGPQILININVIPYH